MANKTPRLTLGPKCQKMISEAYRKGEEVIVLRTYKRVGYEFESIMPVVRELRSYKKLSTSKLRMLFKKYPDVRKNMIRGLYQMETKRRSERRKK